MSAIDLPLGKRREKFMGNAEQVGAPRPAPAAPAPRALGSSLPRSGAANQLGSGSAPVGMGLGETGVRAAGVAKGLVPAPAAPPGPLMRTLGTVGKGLGVAGAGIGAVSAGNDINNNGLNVSNGVDMATSVAGGVGALASAPVAVGAGSLAVGKALGQRFMPNAVATGLARTVETLNSPIAETYDRMRAGGPFLRPEQPGIAGPNLDPAAVAAFSARDAQNQVQAPQQVVPTIANAGKASTPTTPGQTQAMGNVRAPAPAAPAIESLDPRSDRGLRASRNLDARGYVPESGTGIMRNNSTGAITQFNSTPQPEIDPAANAEAMRRAYATSPTLDTPKVELPSALATFQRAVKTGNLGDIVAAKAGLRAETAAKAEAGENERLGMTLGAADERNRATLSQSSRTSLMTARQKQAQDDREYALSERRLGLDEQRVGLEGQRVGLAGMEYGAKRDSESIEQARSAEKALTDRYESQFRTPDGKPDAARVARFKTGVQTFLGNKQAELAELVSSGKGTPEDAAMLKKLQTKGAAALDEEDLTNIETNIKRGERAEQTAGLTGGSFIKSNDPNAYGIRGRKQNLFGSDTIEMNNGTTAREADFKFTEPANPLMPNWFKTKTDEYGLKGKK
jgi:hypothetical protein